MLSAISSFLPTFNVPSINLRGDHSAQRQEQQPNKVTDDSHDADHDDNTSLTATATTENTDGEHEGDADTVPKKHQARFPETQRPPQRTAAPEVETAKKKKEKGLNETFIVVRPPPSKSNHPLNLQLQLVPPHNVRPATSSSTNTPPRLSVDYSQQSEPPTPVSYKTTKPSESYAASTRNPNDGMTDLRRSVSTRSNRSDVSTSFYSMSSASSVTSFASSGSTASGARRIVPLYNLHAHNVMTNTVTDAGTDAKVAKFSKRSLDVMGVGVWEPVEVWPASSTGLNPQDVLANATANPGHSVVVPSDGDGSIMLTPSSSTSRLSSVDHSMSHEHSPITPSIHLQSASETNSPKRIFSKMFKKKDQSPQKSSSPLMSSPLLSPIAQSPTTPTHSRAHARTSSASFSIPIPIPLPPTPKSPSSAPAGLEHLLPPILGLQPLLSLPPDHQQTISPHIFTTFTFSPPLPPSTYPPHGRPTSYAWVLRKWAKEKNPGDSWLNGLGIYPGPISIPGTNNSGGGGAPVGVEVWIGWTRGKTSVSRNTSAGNKKTRRASTTKGVPEGSFRPGSATSSRPTSGFVDPIYTPRDRTRSISPNPNRTSTLHPTTTSTADKRSSYASQPDSHRETSPSEAEEDQESDPEDSETPWICTLHVVPTNTTASQHLRQRSHLPPTSSFRTSYHSKHATEGAVPETITEEGKESGKLKVKLGSLIPAPHHPKVLGQLKMPFPVPDISIYVPHSTVTLHPRSLGPDGSVQRGEIPSGAGIVVLSAEELKDVVSSTAFWLIVREGFGGIGKVKRKGDGWRIRA